MRYWILIGLVVGCEGTATHGGPAEPLERLRSSLGPDQTLHEGGWQRTLDGEFGFRRIRLSQGQGRLSRNMALLSDGEVVPLAEAEARLSGEHFREFGRIGLESAQRLIDGGAELQALVHYNPELRPQSFREALGGRLLEDMPATGTLVLVDLEASQLIELSKRDWVHKVHVVDEMPAQAFGIPRLQQIPGEIVSLGLQQWFNANGIYGDGANIGVIEINMNAPGLGEGCEVLDENESFDRASITYRAPAIQCSADSQCGVCTNTSVMAGQGVCRNGRCVNRHATYVASSISKHQTCDDLNDSVPPLDYCDDLKPGSSRCVCPTADVMPGCSQGPQYQTARQRDQFLECTQPYGPGPGASGGISYNASEAGLFIDNLAEVDDMAELMDSYEWMVSNDVKVVNNSWALIDFANPSRITLQDVVEDMYARYDDVVVVRAAANEEDYTRCNGLNSVCVGGYSNEHVSIRERPSGELASDGSVRSSIQNRMWRVTEFLVSSLTSWKSPLAPPNFPDPERAYEVQKPNVGALQLSHWMPYFGSSENLSGDDLRRWQPDPGGNSFGAGNVSGLLGMFRARCDEVGKPKSQRQVRADLYAVSYRNPTIEEDYQPGSFVDLGRTPLVSGPPAPGVEDVCKGEPFRAGDSEAGRFFGFPTNDERFECDYALGVGPVESGGLAWKCREPPMGGGSGGEPGSNDIDGESGRFFGDEPTIPGLPSLQTGGSNVATGEFEGPITDETGETLEPASPLGSAILGVFPEPSDVGVGTVDKRVRTEPSIRFRSNHLLSFVEAGSRVRIAMVYDSCAKSASTPFDLRAINNIDLALCGDLQAGEAGNSPFCFFVSESLDDNVEGMQVTVPQDLHNLRALELYNAPLEACPNKDGSMPASATEDVAISWVWWGPP